jgi:hypothetical protein
VMSVAIDVHKLWSRTGASPHAGNFGHLPFRLQPIAGCQFFGARLFAKILEDPNLAVVELSDEKVLLVIAVNIGPTGGGIPRAFNADGAPVRLQTNRIPELRSATASSAGAEHDRR